MDQIDPNHLGRFFGLHFLLPLFGHTKLAARVTQGPGEALPRGLATGR